MMPKPIPEPDLPPPRPGAPQPGPDLPPEPESGVPPEEPVPPRPGEPIPLGEVGLEDPRYLKPGPADTGPGHGRAF